jgi:hypothetical protein
MSWHDVISLFNSGLLVALILGGLQFHRQWAEQCLMVNTLWSERERRIDADIDARAVAAAKAFAKGASN